MKNGIQMGDQLVYVSRFVQQSREKDLILGICEKRDTYRILSDLCISFSTLKSWRGPHFQMDLPAGS